MTTTAPIGAHLIGGDWSTDAPGGTAVSDNPARPDEPVGEYPLGDAGTAAQAVGAAVEAQAAWRAAGFGFRSRILERAAVLFDERADELALVCTLEEGKTLAESRGEAVLSAETCRYQAGLAKTSTERIFPTGNPGETIRTVRAPLGVVGIITPWNFPILIPVWKIAPALVAGNPVVWKPASNTPLTAVAIAAVFTDAGLPAAVLNLVLGPGSMGGALVADERVDGVSFTGSVGVGRGIRDVVTARNGRVQLELGGHNPCIVFPDADLDMAVTAVVGGAMGATGQKCTATRRIIAVGDVHDELVDRLAVAVTALKVGDGQDPATAIGPLVSAGARTEVMEAIDQARAEGAETVAITEGVKQGLVELGAPSKRVLVAPDGVRFELQEDPQLPMKAAGYHIHFNTPDYLELMAWYVDIFSGVQASRGNIETTVNVPGQNLSFATSRTPREPTQGRAIDHIGFEVDDLEAFVQKLEARGIEFDLGYTDVAPIELKIAFFTDPSGVYIELTEGFDEY